MAKTNGAVTDIDDDWYDDSSPVWMSSGCTGGPPS
jgi:hypothetical protein